MSTTPEGPGAAYPPPGATTVDEDGWERLHPLSPVLRGGVMMLAVAGYFVSRLWDGILSAVGMAPPADADQSASEWEVMRAYPLLAALGTLLVLAAIVGIAALNWRFSRFRVTSSQIELRTGWLFRQHRQVALERIQAVEISRPLLAQILGLSKVIVQAAGGEHSQLALAYLGRARADQVRTGLQARAGLSDEAALRPAEPALPGGAEAPAPGVPTPGAPAPGVARSPRPVVDVPNGRLFLAVLLHPSTAIALVGALVAVIALSLGGGYAVGWLIPIVLGLGVSRVRELLKNGNFQLVDHGTSLRATRGLTEVTAKTVPLHRVQALRVSQVFWWRYPGWWRLEVNVAGVHHAQDGVSDTTVLPVGTGPELRRVLGLLTPGLDEALLTSALRGSGDEGGWVTLPRAARWLDPLVWRHAGYAVAPGVLVLRRGLLTREVAIVPHARIQSITLAQGPLQRRLDLADVEFDSTTGPVRPRVHNLGVDQAEQLLHAESWRASEARRGVDWLRGSTVIESTSAVRSAPDLKDLP